MRIHELVWPEDRIEHIARHGVTPEEVEEVCFGRAFVQCSKSQGENPVYYVLGQTVAGRYLFCVRREVKSVCGCERLKPASRRCVSTRCSPCRSVGRCADSQWQEGCTESSRTLLLNGQFDG